MSYPHRFRKVDRDGEVFLLRLPSVRLWLVGAGLPRRRHSNAFLLCLLLVFFYFLSGLRDGLSVMTPTQLCPKINILMISCFNIG